ncbi:MAG: stage II sporulation protein P [Clostridia bacterium]|nr:stage II sporulation protein P [Clostridia bacterium]
MVNVTIINRKDAIKYLVRIGIAIVIVSFLARYFTGLREKDISNITKLKDESKMAFISCLDDTIPTIQEVNKCENTDKDNYIEPLKLALTKELGVLDSIEKKYVSENIVKSSNESSISSEDLEEQNRMKEVPTGIKTEVLPNNVPTKYTNTHNSVQIKNESKYSLTQEMLNTEGVTINNKNVLIFHTHTCESYTPSETSKYNQTGNFRTTDLNFSVARVGTELQNHLKAYGYNVIHDKTYHDYPSYSGSYGNSLTTVQNLLKVNKDFDVVIDIHRDAIADSTYAPTVKIGDEYASQLMFVIGTNGSGLEHDNWVQNLKFAIKVQEKANEMYPGLFKPMMVRNSRYNQNVSKAACIIEVGATGNTLEQSNNSMKYLAKILSEVMK